jgi:DNA excision repair protein ERCC-2
MKNEDVEEVLRSLREDKVPTLLLAVQGGHFSEGVDYPGEMLIGAFIVGPALPHFDFEREQMKQYYQLTYQQGRDYAYTYPAMARAVQAAGRVIRTEADRGIIVLIDDRFLAPEFGEGMPADWFGESPKELVSNSILQDLKSFWSLPESP